MDDRNSTGRQLPDNSAFAIVQLGPKAKAKDQNKDWHNYPANAPAVRNLQALRLEKHASWQCFAPLKRSVRDDRLKFRHSFFLPDLM